MTRGSARRIPLVVFFVGLIIAPIILKRYYKTEAPAKQGMDSQAAVVTGFTWKKSLRRQGLILFTRDRSLTPSLII